MAKNYTFNEAVKIIAKGTDLEAITDIGRRYPVLAHKIAVVTAKAGEEFVDLMGYMPDYLTANKVNTVIKAGITESGSDDEDAEDTEAEATTEDAGEDATEATAQWDEFMSAKQLWDILGKAGKRKLAKSTKKADLVEACKQAFGAATEAEAEDDAAKAEATEAESEEDDDWGDEEAEAPKKEDKKAAPKASAKSGKAKAAKKAEAESEDDEDWDI